MFYNISVKSPITIIVIIMDIRDIGVIETVSLTPDDAKSKDDLNYRKEP